MQCFTCFVSAFRRHTRGRDCEAESPWRPSCATEQEIAFLRKMRRYAEVDAGVRRRMRKRSLPLNWGAAVGGKKGICGGEVAATKEAIPGGEGRRMGGRQDKVTRGVD